MLAALGVFLALTGFAEIGKQWWAVFPHYIADPTLGTHFGRARGPALNSASLGVFLTICFWAAWMLIPRASRLGQGGLAVIPIWQLPRRWRLPAALGMVMCGAVGVAALGHSITDLNRKDTDDSAEHSVYQRASFVYVSMRMFRDSMCAINRSDIDCC